MQYTLNNALELIVALVGIALTVRCVMAAIHYYFWRVILGTDLDYEIINNSRILSIVSRATLSETKKSWFTLKPKDKTGMFNRSVRWAIPKNLTYSAVLFHFEYFTFSILAIVGLLFGMLTLWDRIHICTPEYRDRIYAILG